MYENISVDGLRARMLGRVSNKLDKREGSIIFDAISPTALELQFLYIELERVIREAYGDTASHEFLILRCRERGIAPCAATNAVLKGVFSPENIDVSGKRFSVEDLNYTVGESLGGGAYRVVCETSGAVGNRYLGNMIPIDYINGLASAELTELLIPGEDEEDTEALRARYFASFDQQAFGGNVRDYTDKINALAGVGGCKISRVWNGGLKPAELVPDTAVSEWFEGVAATLAAPVREWLTRVYTAASERKLTVGGAVAVTLVNSEFDVPSDELAESVQTALDPVRNAGEGVGIAPIGHVVNVRKAVGVPVFVTANIEFKSGYGWSNLRETLGGVIEAYLLELRREWAASEFLTVRLSQIETRLLSVEGVLDISDTAVNGAAENLVLGEAELPVFGGVSGASK